MWDYESYINKEREIQKNEEITLNKQKNSKVTKM